MKQRHDMNEIPLTSSTTLISELVRDFRVMRTHHRSHSNTVAALQYISSVNLHTLDRL